MLLAYFSSAFNSKDVRKEAYKNTLFILISKSCGNSMQTELFLSFPMLIAAQIIVYNGISAYVQWWLGMMKSNIICFKIHHLIQQNPNL